jgi:hypothetical protein
MLTSKLLRIKNFLTKATGDTVVDLISSTFSFLRTSGQTEGFVRVREEEAMRPDLISIRLYSNQQYYDALMKYNGISNPFSINPGEILVIPPYRELEQMLVSPRLVPEKGAERKAKNEDKLVNPKTVKDRKRLEALKDRVKEIVPPNVNTEGNRNVKVKDGRVIFGEDVTQVNKDNCPVPISRARLIQQLTKSSLF